MDSFTIQLVSKGSGELFPDNTLSSFTNFLPEQLNLEGQWEVAISEISYPSMYQNITEGKFKFSTRNFQNLRQPTVSNLAYKLPSQTLWRLWIILFKREKTTTKLAKQSRFLAEHKKLHLRLQTITLVLHSVVPTWVRFLVTMWETILGYWWKEKALMNHNLPVTSFVSIRWWFTVI